MSNQKNKYSNKVVGFVFFFIGWIASICYHATVMDYVNDKELSEIVLEIKATDVDTGMEIAHEKLLYKGYDYHKK